MDNIEIQKILPHRYPFLLVDKILEVNGQKAVGIKNVTVNESFFQGHFPGHPVMPGVLITEAMAQVGAIALMKSVDVGDTVPYLASLEKIRFKRPVFPGDQLRIEVELTGIKRNVAKMNAKALVDGKVVAEGVMMCASVKK